MAPTKVSTQCLNCDWLSHSPGLKWWKHLTFYWEDLVAKLKCGHLFGNDWPLPLFLAHTICGVAMALFEGRQFCRPCCFHFYRVAQDFWRKLRYFWMLWKKVASISNFWGCFAIELGWFWDTFHFVEASFGCRTVFKPVWREGGWPGPLQGEEGREGGHRRGEF